MAVTSCQVCGEKIRKEGVVVAGRVMEEGGTGKRKVLSCLMKYSVLSVLFYRLFPPRGWISRSFFRPPCGRLEHFV